MIRRIPLGLRYMMLAAFLFSLMGLFVKLAGRRLPSQEIVLVRSVVTLVYSYLAVRWLGLSPWGRRKGLLFLRGLTGLAALSCVYYAFTALPLADATVLQYTNPVLTALLAALVLKESIGAGEIAGMVLSLAGVVLIARPAFLFGSLSGSPDLAAVGIALLGAVLTGVAYVLVRKLRETEHPLVIVFYFPLVSTFGALPGALPGAVWPTWQEWLMLLFGVSLTAQIAQIYLTKGLHLERAGRASAIGYLQILFAAVWGMLFLDEYPDLATVAGAALVVAGVFLASRKGTSPVAEAAGDVPEEAEPVAPPPTRPVPRPPRRAP